uniref:carbonic anhydrase n=1 Tax=Cacopsylla melanoneura TaxID=428564 RepID=A0A8D8ZPY4_9HEMI
MYSPSLAQVLVLMIGFICSYSNFAAASDQHEFVQHEIRSLPNGAAPANSHEQHHFGYDPDEPDELGPERWSEDYRQCTGKYQSPIDIEETLVSRVSLPELKFHGFEQEPISTMITNNGHTVLLNPKFADEPYITGGPLGFKYVFSQLHFHWGVNDSVGSEDLINNKSYPMELHMVFFNKDYDTSDQAQGYKDGLVVLAAFVEVSEKASYQFQSIVSALPNVTMPNQHVTVAHVPGNLNDMLPKKRNLYFTYKGSLTTPPCSEVVTWIDFKNPILLSHTQLNEFRQLHKNGNKFLTHNARPIQPLSGRPIWYNAEENYSASNALTPAFLGLLVLSFVPLLI